MYGGKPRSFLFLRMLYVPFSAHLASLMCSVFLLFYYDSAPSTSISFLHNRPVCGVGAIHPAHLPSQTRVIFSFFAHTRAQRRTCLAWKLFQGKFYIKTFPPHPGRASEEPYFPTLRYPLPGAYRIRQHRNKPTNIPTTVSSRTNGKMRNKIVRAFLSFLSVFWGWWFPLSRKTFQHPQRSAGTWSETRRKDFHHVLLLLRMLPPSASTTESTNRPRCCCCCCADSDKTIHSRCCMYARRGPRRGRLRTRRRRRRRRRCARYTHPRVHTHTRFRILSCVVRAIARLKKEQPSKRRRIRFFHPSTRWWHMYPGRSNLTSRHRSPRASERGNRVFLTRALLSGHCRQCPQCYRSARAE